MRSYSILVLLSCLSAFTFASLLSAPTATPTSLTTITGLPSSSLYLLRNDSRNGDLGNESGATRTTGSSGKSDPLITAAPTAEEMMIQNKYHLTTYWSCVTLQTYVHCGWHQPVLVGGTEIAGASCAACNAGRVAMVAAGVVMVAGAVL